MSGVTPTSTTAQLAGAVPKENAASSALPGTFPETPANEPAAFSVNPIPASEGAGNPVKLAPGEAVPAPSEVTPNTVSSTVHDDEELKAADAAQEQTFSVSPIPATAGAGNPIKLAAGEPVPPASEITSNTVASTATTDKKSYENGTAVAGGEAKAADLPPAKNLIPESSLPMGEGGVGTYDAGPTISSVGPNSTTVGLAAAVPLEKDTRNEVPEVVTVSQEEAHFPPEASADPEEVREKSEVERELLGEVPIARVTSDETHGEADTYKVVGTVRKVPSLTAVLPESAHPPAESEDEVSMAAPRVVRRSISEARASPEAAAYAEEIGEKAEVEAQLLRRVPTSEAAGEPAPDIARDSPADKLMEAELEPPHNRGAESREVSPGTVPEERRPLQEEGGEQLHPVVTWGGKREVVPEVSGTPAPRGEGTGTVKASEKAEQAAGEAKEARQKKRRSFFGRLKDKLKEL